MIKMGDIVADSTGLLMYVTARTTDGRILCMWREGERIATEQFEDADLTSVPTAKEAAQLVAGPELSVLDYVDAVSGAIPKLPPDGAERWYVDEDFEKPRAVKVVIGNCNISAPILGGTCSVPFGILALTQEDAFQRAEKYVAEDVQSAEDRVQEQRKRQERLVEHRVRLYVGRK